MASLPYKPRAYNTVTVNVGWGRKKRFKIPAELTVEETERLLELVAKVENLAKQEVAAENYYAQRAALKEFWGYLFAQATILFQHYHPEVTEQWLRKHLTQSEVVGITNFFEASRFYKKLDTQAKGKKKVSANETLMEIRRLVVFCVHYGFGLYDLKKLYIDEFFEYYYQLVYNLEAAGVLAEESYNKARGVDNSANIINQAFAKLK
jgi:hypothetical protein